MTDQEEKKRKVGFSFSAAPKTKLQKLSTFSQEENHKEKEIEYVTSIEGNNLVSLNPKTKKEPLVIPLPRPPRKYRPSVLPTTTELVSDETEFNGPLVLQYQMPELEGITDEAQRFKIDLSLRPDVPNIEAYDRIPVDQYGEALLRGMGWQPGGAIGLHAAQPVEIVLPKVRQHRLGLGAEPKPLELDSTKKISPKQRAQIEKKHRAHGLFIGALVSVHGSYDGLYAVILQIGLDHAVVRLHSLEDALVPTSDLTAVDPHTLNRDHPALQFWRKNKDRKLPVSSSSEEPKKPYDDRYGLIKSEDLAKPLDPKKKDPNLSKKGKSQSDLFDSGTWIRPDIHVRIRNKNSKHGKHYSKKGCVADVMPGNKCTIILDGTSTLLEDVDQNDLETVLPKAGGRVLIVNGKHSGRSGKLLSKSLKNDKAQVLFPDNGRMLECGLDDIAEYFGSSVME